ncbi:AbrB/MazE/SpoVT family DNA-binding domain-containing protein [Patescibacteria group bacterium]|nr:AbrB/MazE/SpoVT family DNA-binding domain-containing protein [Patescibacteria group bacterium]MBU2632903.1 AbrB/MazE/SpoVT family DNA-binding domain-containing protein [Patescibacteria group bacterium]
MKTLVKITKNYQITLPAKLRKSFSLKEGDYLEADLQRGKFVFAPKKMIDIDPAQKWFWTKEWQKGEREVDKDITEGRLAGPFSSAKDLIKELES